MPGAREPCAAVVGRMQVAEMHGMPGAGTHVVIRLTYVVPVLGGDNRKVGQPLRGLHEVLPPAEHAIRRDVVLGGHAVAVELARLGDANDCELLRVHFCKP